MRGLEPPWVTPHDPKSCASASSATSALFFNNLQEKLKIGITFGITLGITFDQFFHHFWVIFQSKNILPKCDFQRNKVYFTTKSTLTKKVSAINNVSCLVSILFFHLLFTHLSFVAPVYTHFVLYLHYVSTHLS